MATIREKLELLIGIEGADKFGRDLNKAKGDVDKTAKGMGSSFKDMAKAAAATGAAIIAAMTAIGVVVYKLASQVAKLGDSWDKMSKRTGLAAEILSALSFAADRSGTSIQSLEVGFRRLAANMQDAAKGTGIAKDAFAKLGVKVTDSTGRLKSQDKLLYELADTLGQWKNSAEQAAMAQDIFGRSGVEMLPMLAEGSEGIQRLMGRAEDLGEVFSGKLARDSANFEDAMRDMDGAVQGLRNSIATQLIPAITDLTNNVLTPAIQKLKSFSDWYNAILTSSGGYKGAGGQGIAETADAMNRLKAAGVLSGAGRGQGNPRARLSPIPGYLKTMAGGPFGNGRVASRSVSLEDQIQNDRLEMLANQTVSDTARPGILSHDARLAAVAMGKEIEEQFEYVGERAAEIMRDVPKDMEDGFSDSLRNIEAQMMALGMKGSGIFGGIAGIKAGMGGLGLLKAGSGSAQLMQFMNSAAFAGQIASGFVAAAGPITNAMVGGIAKSLLGGGKEAVQTGIGLTASEEEQQKYQNDILMARQRLGVLDTFASGGYGDRESLNLSGVGVVNKGNVDALRRQQQATLEGLLSNGPTSGSATYGGVTTITEVQAGQMMSTLETQRIQDAERNAILRDIRTHTRTTANNTAISAGAALMRFSGA